MLGMRPLLATEIAVKVGSRTGRWLQGDEDGASNTPGAPKPSPARRNWTGSTSCARANRKSGWRQSGLTELIRSVSFGLRGLLNGRLRAVGLSIKTPEMATRARHQCRTASERSDAATGAGVGQGVPSGQLVRFVSCPFRIKELSCLWVWNQQSRAERISLLLSIHHNFC